MAGSSQVKFSFWLPDSIRDYFTSLTSLKQRKLARFRLEMRTIKSVQSKHTLAWMSKCEMMVDWVRICVNWQTHAFCVLSTKFGCRAYATWRPKSDLPIKKTPARDERSEKWRIEWANKENFKKCANTCNKQNQSKCNDVNEERANEMALCKQILTIYGDEMASFERQVEKCAKAQKANGSGSELNG